MDPLVVHLQQRGGYDLHRIATKGTHRQMIQNKNFRDNILHGIEHFFPSERVKSILKVKLNQNVITGNILKVNASGTSSSFATEWNPTSNL